MRLRTLRPNVPLAGKRVLMRVDLNVPIKNGRAVDGMHGKIARAAVDVAWLAQRGARVIIFSHLGRPEGKRIPAYSMRPVAKRLEELLGAKVPVANGLTGKKVEASVARMKDGDFLLLENVRFDPREEKNSTAMAQELARLADLYVNDAFSVCHRAHTSVDAITSELPSYAGPLLMNEVETLEKLNARPKTPFYMFIGGLKIRTKLPLMQRLLPKIDKLFLGGAIANTFFCALANRTFGKSVHEKSELNVARELMGKWEKKIVLPTDVLVARSCRKDAKSRNVALPEVGENDMIVDIGNESMKRYVREMDAAKTILWNGPLGYYECGPF